MRARRLDHVGLVGTELAPLRDAWRALGFAPTEPRPLLGRDAAGRDVELGQSSCHAVLEGGYVELTAVAPGVRAHHLDAWRRRGDGLWILAFGTDDAAAARERAARGGLPVTPVMEAARAIDYGTTHGDARFRWFMLEAAATPEALLCVVEHRTPELVFQPAVQRHPNGARVLAGVTIVLDDPHGAAHRYAQLLGVDPVLDAAGCAFDGADGSVDLLTPAAWRERYAGSPPPHVPGVAAVRIAAGPRVDLAERLERAGKRVHRAGERTWLDAADGGGVVVEFVD
jgi:hypothetical protein